MDTFGNVIKSNFYFTFTVFVLGFGIPFSQGHPVSTAVMVLVAVVLYFWCMRILGKIVFELVKFQDNIEELKSLYVTVAIFCASAYFLFAVTDSQQATIAGIRKLKSFAMYDLYSLTGIIEYVTDLLGTYLNSVYYSVVVMTTLGDSNVTIKALHLKLIVAFEVITVLSLTVFKISEYFRTRASIESRIAEERILNEIRRNNECDIYPKFLTKRLLLWGKGFHKYRKRLNKRGRSEPPPV